MYLIVTIDTEEDNWLPYANDAITTNNIERIIELQALFDEYRVKPTYLITYSVATSNRAIDIIGEIQRSGRCEIGTHCHPWTTPPFEEERSMVNTMLCNLSPELQFKKIARLHETIQENFGITPTSFRSGRWGYGQEVADTIIRLGYITDTSITAYTNWNSYHGPDYSNIGPEPFWCTPDAIYERKSSAELLEVPATVGYLQDNPARVNGIYNRIKRSPLNKLKLLSVLDRLRMLNKVYLSPEIDDARQMSYLAEKLRVDGHSVINMFFHSPTLMAGLTPFTRTEADVSRFIKRIRDFLEYMKAVRIVPITLSEAANVLYGRLSDDTAHPETYV